MEEVVEEEVVVEVEEEAGCVRGGRAARASDARDTREAAELEQPQQLEHLRVERGETLILSAA